MTFKKVDPKMNFPKMEEEILKFWDEQKIFEKSVEKESTAGDFIFYEGPPTANGKPGLHHVLARSFKDIIPRYKTMKGYRVARKAGWDTHGLPVELQVEKALGLRSKQEIENIVPGDVRASVIEFNKKCKESVWEYRDLWEKLTKRMGYWVDMEHPYVTYENSYIESVWWQLAQVAELTNAKGESFVYKGHKVVPYCYRCGTALSSHEVAQGYKETKDNSVYVKFKLIPGQKIGEEFITDDKTYILAWTTTPWTLPGNVALAIRPNTSYSINEMISENGLSGDPNNEKYILSKDLHKVYESDKRTPSIVTYVDSQDLVGKTYESLFEAAGEVMERKVIFGGFVTLDSGTGIVHIAPAFGEDDANVAKEYGLPTLLTVGDDGKMDEGFPGAGIPVKKLNDKNRYAVDDLIIAYLKEHGLFFKEEVYAHEYPFCWRCDTPLIYFAKPSWFIRMSELRNELEKNNEGVIWVPEHIKEGRFGEWLRGVKDWAISRERYWGTPIPIWECHGENANQIGCGHKEIISSARELAEKSGVTLDDLHKPYIDDITLKCEKCNGVMERTPEVLDVWFDSGAMPLAQFNYPAMVTEEDKKNIEAGRYFPADYICEAIDQTRGWFYTLHAIGTLLNRGGKVATGNAFKNVICLGHVLDGQGKKMSKSKGNVIDPFQMFDEYGADPLRWMLFSLNQPGLPKRFDVKGMRDVQNRVFRMLWNSYSFFVQYASIDNWTPEVDRKTSVQYLDRWIISDLHALIQIVDEKLAVYDVYASTQAIEMFIDRLSNWYIRLNRDRFWKNENDSDKNDAYQTLHTVIVTLAKLMAPFTPFISEEIYRNLTDDVSVHLAEYPRGGTVDHDITIEMSEARGTITEGLRQRSEKQIRVRQPLASVTIREQKIREECKEIIKKELNVKEVLVDLNAKGNVILNWDITPELLLEGEMNEINRAIQDGRKKAGFNVEDRVALGYIGKEKVFENFGDEIAKKVLATEVKNEPLENPEYAETIELEGEKFEFQLKRV